MGSASRPRREASHLTPRNCVGFGSWRLCYGTSRTWVEKRQRKGVRTELERRRDRCRHPDGRGAGAKPRSSSAWRGVACGLFLELTQGGRGGGWAGGTLADEDRGGSRGRDRPRPDGAPPAPTASENTRATGRRRTDRARATRRRRAIGPDVTDSFQTVDGSLSVRFWTIGLGVHHSPRWFAFQSKTNPKTSFLWISFFPRVSAGSVFSDRLTSPSRSYFKISAATAAHRRPARPQ